jgi:hypothetical protein
MKLKRPTVGRLERILGRLEELPPLAKRLLLIRPRYRRDRFTTSRSYEWAERVKAKAIAEGWEVEDLGGQRASRANTEQALSRIAVERPRLVMHYDHGSEYTLYGHPRSGRPDAIERWVPVIDETNIALCAGTLVSAVACSSAAGLGPLAVAEGATGYLGYSEPLVGAWLDSNIERFGEAANAANYALLEGKSPLEAFVIGRRAWDALRSQLIAAAGPSTGPFDIEWWDIGVATWNRDCLTLLQPR